MRFAGVDTSGPEHLAQVVADHWEDAARFLADDHRRDELLGAIRTAWARDHSIYLSGSLYGTHHRVAALIGALDPTRPAIWDGKVVTRDRLVDLARAAQRGNAAAAAEIDALKDHKLLQVFVRHQGHQDLSGIDGTWSLAETRYSIEGRLRSASPIASYVLLEAACDPHAAGALASRARMAVGRRRMRWDRSALDERLDSNPGLALAILEWAGRGRFQAAVDAVNDVLP